MSTLFQMGQNARVLLGGPRAQKPSDRQTLLATLKHAQNLYNRLSNSNKAWATEELDLTVQTDEGDYLLAVSSSFGKPMLVTTTDSSNPSHIERAIEFYEAQNLNYNFMWPNNAAAGFADWYGSPTTAMRIAFYRKAPTELYARIKPVPQATATYRILGSVGDWTSSAALTSAPVLTEHHHLIETRIALSLLPYAEWGDNPAENTQKRREIYQTLKDDESLFDEQLQEYVATITHARMSQRFAPSID
jgi:hypothetical protein